MTTPDGRGPETLATPGELRLGTSVLPNVGDTPSLPAAGSSTPGIAGAAARFPGAPTLPEIDPVSLTSVIARLGNELFAMPPQPAQSAGPIDPSSATPDVTPGAAPPIPSAPWAGSALPTPTPVAASPFAAPLDFASVDLFASNDHPLAALFEDGRLNIPLLDVPSDAPRNANAPSEPRAIEPTTPEPPIATRAPRFADTYEITPAIDLRDLRSTRGDAIDPNALKNEFPILRETVNGKRLVWLDNAATTQKPRAVIDRISSYYEHENSNVHRAAHTLAARSTDAYESARESVRRFLNAPSKSEIVFVRGTTEGINFLAQSWGRRNVNEGDEIVLSWLEHHANIVPWQQLALERGARLRVAPVDDRGQVILEEYEKLLNPKTRLVSFTQVSNALGTITPAKEMIEMAHRHGAKVVLDGAQSVSHMRVDVQDLGADFFVFSGHKVFGPTGIGAVFGRRELLEAMPPWQTGGNMIQDVTFERSTFQPPPFRFEAGTGNIADAVGLGAALDWVTRVGIERIETYEHELLIYATERLATVPGLTMIGTAPSKAGVLSFILAGQKTEEVGGLLDREGIAVRSGHHCAQPILRRFGLEATVRASLAPYNTCEDIDALVEALHRLQAGKGALSS